MPHIHIDSAFDSGNIVVEAITGSEARLTIRRDAHSDFFQWFHFRVSGAKDQDLVLHLTGLASAAYPQGWPGYRACVSQDREAWTRTTTSWNADANGGTLTIRHRPTRNLLLLLMMYLHPLST